MRPRRVTLRYTEVFGGLCGALEAEMWELVRPRPVAPPVFRPRADVTESKTAYAVTIEVPGVSDDDIQVFVHPDALVVSGRRECPDAEDAHWHAAEIRWGPFRFEMALPDDADAERVEVSADRGLLRVVIPKRPGGVV
jgi:HSP20 family protein